MVLPLLEDDCEPTILMGLTPTQSHAESAAPLMGLPPLGDNCGPTLLMGLTLT